MKGKMMSIERLKIKVQSFLPEGWKAGQCFMLSLSGKSSPEMVDARRMGYREGLLAAGQNRVEFKRRWNTETVEQAKTIESLLKANGLDAMRDCGTVYVRTSL